jgi:putative transcriptional regulator
MNAYGSDPTRYNGVMPNATFLAEQLLIAMPGLHDGFFGRSVSLVCQHDEQGAMALMLNRDSEYSLGSLFAQLELACDDPALCGRAVLSGGPVKPERGFILHDDGVSWDSSLQLSCGLTVSSSRDILEALAAGTGPKRFQVLLGYSGWSANQLEAEIADNAWLHAPLSREIIFDVPAERRWQAAAKQLGVDLSLISSQAGRA